MRMLILEAKGDLGHGQGILTWLGIHSCTRCRRQKIKCSGSQPCDGCNKRKLTCIFDDRDQKILVTRGYAPDGLGQRDRKHSDSD